MITIFEIWARSKGAVQNFCQRCSNFTLREIQFIWHVSTESWWILGFFFFWWNFFHVYDILKIICTLSYGQSSIERGFSINKHLVESLQEESLTVLCIVKSHMMANSLTLSNIQFSKAMLENVTASNRRYKVTRKKGRTEWKHKVS